MSYNDDCEHVEKDFIGEFPRGEYDSESEFRICVEKDLVSYEDRDPDVWYHGQITIGNRWSEYSTVHASSSKGSKESVLEVFRLLRDSLNEAIDYLDEL